MENCNPRLLLELELSKPDPDLQIIELLESLIEVDDPDLDMVGMALGLGGVEVAKTDD